MKRRDRDDYAEMARWIAPWLVLVGGLISMFAMIMPARADGLPSYQARQAPSTSAVHCFVGAFASGSFERESMAVSTLMSNDMGTSAWGGGPQVGCDYVSGFWDIGVLADYTFQSGNASATLAGLTATGSIADEGAVVGRLGVYPSQSTLLYILGGVAFQAEKNMTLAPTKFSMPFSGGTGPIVGGGIETALAKDLTGFIEYRHEDFGTRTGTLASVIPTSSSTVEDKVMLGLRYRLW